MPKSKPEISVNIGDVVKFTLGDRILQAEIGMINIAGAGSERGIWVGGESFPLKRLHRMGYDYEVVKKAEYALPEKPGLYKNSDNSYILRLFKDQDGGLFWRILGSDEVIDHRDLYYSILPLTLIEEM